MNEKLKKLKFSQFFRIFLIPELVVYCSGWGTYFLDDWTSSRTKFLFFVLRINGNLL
jgi:hypothetical protein